MAERLGRDLAARGLVIVSGLARGIDACAHHGALSTPAGTTIAVLGCGIDVVYPKENKKLFEEIEKRGAIISEFVMGTFPDRKISRFGTGSLPGCRSGLCASKERSTLDH